MDLFVRDLTIAAVSLALYGVIGQFFTQPSTIFPSTIINSDLFQRLVRLPDPVVPRGDGGDRRDLDDPRPAGARSRKRAAAERD